MHYEIIIIGAGPAGATAAIELARKGRRVLLLEKSRFPREKLCGEFLTPECLELLDRLNALGRMIAAGAKPISAFNLFAPDGRSIGVPLKWIGRNQSYGLSISRARMDLILLERAREAGAEVREGFHVSPHFQREPGFGVIEGKADGETIERYSAPIIIDASGRNGVFSAHTGLKSSRLRGSRLFGCKVHLRGIDQPAGIGELFFFEEGYGGITEIEGDRSNLCFLTTEEVLREARGDREKLLDLTMRTNQAAEKRLRTASLAGEWHGTGPIIFGNSAPIDGVIAIGDAGAFIDPFTGSGILLALTSGELLSKVINRAFDVGVKDIDSLSKEYRKIHRRHFGFRYKAAALLRRLAFKPLARDAMISILSRRRSVLKLIALSTRRNNQL